MAFPTGWSSRRLYIPQGKVSGSSNLSNFPICIKDGSLPPAVYSGLQTGEVSSSWLASDTTLEAYYRFENGALTTDSSGNGFTLTNNGTVTDTTGKYSNAADFGASNSSKYFSLGATSPLATLGFNQTICFWIKLSTEITSGTYTFFESRSTTGSKSLRVQLNYDYNSGTPRLRILVDNATTSLQPNYTASLGTTVWHHIALSFNDTTGALRLYLDSILVIDTTFNNTGGTTGWSNSITGIGGIGSNYVSGLIDDFAIISRVLASEEIKHLYIGGGDLRFTTDAAGTTEVPFELVALDTVNRTSEIWVKIPTLYYNQDTDVYVWYGKSDAVPYAANATYGSENVWTNYTSVFHLQGNSRDSASNANHGTDTSITYATANGLVGQGGDFNGSSSRAVLDTDKGKPGGNFTITALVNPDTNPAAASVLTNYFQSSGSNRYGYRFFLESGAVKMMVHNNTTWGEKISTATISTGSWSHVAGVWDGSEISVFLNGSQDGAAVSWASGISYSTSVMNIGARSSSTDYFDGKLDEVRIRPGALSDEWIATESTMFSSPTTFIIHTYVQTLSEQISLNDVIVRTTSLVKTETITLVDTNLQLLVKVLDLLETLTLSDTIIRTTSILISETVVLNDTLVRTGQKVLQEIITLVDSVVKRSAKAKGRVVLSKKSIGRTLWTQASKEDPSQYRE